MYSSKDFVYKNKVTAMQSDEVVGNFGVNSSRHDPIRQLIGKPEGCWKQMTCPDYFPFRGQVNSRPSALRGSRFPGRGRRGQSNYRPNFNVIKIEL